MLSREVGGANGGEREEDHQGTCIMDTRKKPKVGRIDRGGGDVWG